MKIREARLEDLENILRLSNEFAQNEALFDECFNKKRAYTKKIKRR